MPERIVIATIQPVSSLIRILRLLMFRRLPRWLPAARLHPCFARHVRTREGGQPRNTNTIHVFSQLITTGEEERHANTDRCLYNGLQYD
jgi:hypothetical protein